jgi:hypothetical protein
MIPSNKQEKANYQVEASNKIMRQHMTFNEAKKYAIKLKLTSHRDRPVTVCDSNPYTIILRY